MAVNYERAEVNHNAFFRAAAMVAFLNVVQDQDGWGLKQDLEGHKQLRLDRNGEDMCPLTAVAENIAGVRGQLDEAVDVGLQLGLDQHDVDDIILAADDQFPCPQDTRDALLVATGTTHATVFGWQIDPQDS